MQAHCQFALKEWAVVCEALANGAQQLLFRKGGIHDQGSGFRPEHQEFWLYPTGFHQTAEGVREEFRTLAEEVLEGSHDARFIPIRHFCTVQAVHWFDDMKKLELLQPFHVLSEEAVAKRFHYRRPGVFVLALETKSLVEPVLIPHEDRFDGCHSWVELSESLSTERLELRDSSKSHASLQELLGMLNSL